MKKIIFNIFNNNLINNFNKITVPVTAEVINNIITKFNGNMYQRWWFTVHLDNIGKNIAICGLSFLK